MEKKLKKQLFILFFVYVVMDFITTYQITVNPELIEINSFVRYLISDFGWIGFLIVKLAVFGMLGGLSIMFTTLKIEDQNRIYSFGWTWTVLFTIVLLFSTYVMINNLVLILF